MTDSEKAIRCVLSQIGQSPGMIARILAEQEMGLRHNVEHVQALLAELDAARLDAKRYRWYLQALIDQEFELVERTFVRFFWKTKTPTKAEIDAAIDAAIAQQDKTIERH